MPQYQPTLTTLLESVETLQYRLLQLNRAAQDHLYSPGCDISAADLADRQRALDASVNKVYTDFEMLKRAGGRTPERRQRWTKAEFLEISEEMDDIVADYKRVRRFIESVVVAAAASSSSSSQEGEFE